VPIERKDRDEAARDEQVGGLGRELPGRRAIPEGLAQERPQRGEALVDLGLLGAGVELVRGEVVMAP
jgi:hypothetical protein